MRKYLESLRNSFNLFVMFVLALILSAFLLFSVNTNATQEISLSDLAEKVQNEEIESIVVESGSSKINIKLKDGSHLYSNENRNTSLERFLLDSNVSVDKIKDANIKIEGNKRALFMSSFLPFLFPVILFFILYSIILVGFKILYIESVPRQKISIFIFIMFFYSLFLSPTIATVVYNNLTESRSIVLFLNSIFSLLLIFLVLKYYFLLSGKRLQQFFLYLIAINLILSFTINMLYV
ncbi:MAG: ATP-dependent metallopeptidase FtsH/Yme1/Tma family protein [Candidatus Pacebacteria bacterium]|nr:ATP-dependent metallopeptidase FtsH/Yme1/Tma family protein [Candidatus Paceibacterota bacterium]